MTAESIIAEMEARTGAATRAKELPAWALLLRSPFKTYPEATSWLGGVPKVPRSFAWPKGNGGRPLHFIAQIDLSALSRDPRTGATAPGLPGSGAALFFIGDGYAVRVLSAGDMAGATDATVPADLEALSEQGFWGEGQTFTRWAVDPVPYLSRGEERPDFLPDPCAEPRQWITTWGLAALEASIAHDALALELRLGREFMEYRRAQEAQGRELPSANHIKDRIAHCALMEDHAPQLLAALQDWQAAAGAHRAEDRVHTAALSEIFAQRTRLSKAMRNNYGAQQVLAGSVHHVWEKILSGIPVTAQGRDFSALAPAYRPLIEAKVTDWRGHRLFGLEPEFPNNGEDLRDQNPMISIAADGLLGTQSEHDYGFSIWLNTREMAHGRHAGGQLIRHCAV